MISEAKQCATYTILCALICLMLEGLLHTFSSNFLLPTSLLTVLGFKFFLTIKGCRIGKTVKHSQNIKLYTVKLGYNELYGTAKFVRYNRVDISAYEFINI
jgi:hypothetical protein